MIKLEDSASRLLITIGHISTQLICDYPAVIADLKNRYTGYTNVRMNDPNFTVKIEVREIMEIDKRDEIYVRDGTFYITSKTQEGEINLEGCTGFISVSHRHILEGVDYYLRVLYALLVFRASGILFHAAGISYEGRGYAFFGHSGSGKTTISRSSRGKRVLNDDLVMLIKENGTWKVHSTPFWNELKLKPEPASAQLVGLFLLVKGHQVHIEKINRGVAIAEMISCMPVISVDPPNIQKLIPLVSELLDIVPVFQLHFLPDDSYWDVILPHNAQNTLR